MSRQGRLRIVLTLNLVLVAGLVAVGISAHSLGVWAEGADYLADAAGIGVSLLAIWLDRRPETAVRPSGYPRATLFAALLNSGWLLILSLFVIADGVDRLVTGTGTVHGLAVLVASGIAAVVMVAGALVPRGDPDGIEGGDDVGGDLNMRAVLLDTAADAAVAGGVASAGAVIAATGSLYWIDPAVALAVAAVVAYHAFNLVTQATAGLRGGVRPRPAWRAWRRS
ncbi:MAG: cation diffusion facilitator family transporter [Acidimicrobiales bacterium]